MKKLKELLTPTPTPDGMLVHSNVQNLPLVPTETPAWVDRDDVQFSNDWRKTNTKVIIRTNHNRQRDEPIRIQSNTVAYLKRGKNRAHKVPMVLVCLLIR